MDDSALLLAGWGTFASRLEPLAIALEAVGVTSHVWAYSPGGDLDGLARGLAHAAGSAGTDRVHLVGHSLGGLVVAAAAIDHLSDTGDATIATVTTVNTPWRGTWVSYTAGTARLARQLRWGSPELAALRARFESHLTDGVGPDWLLLSAAGDLATPATTALGAGTRAPRLTRRVVPVAGHSVSLLHPRLVDAIRSHVGTRIASEAGSEGGAAS